MISNVKQVCLTQPPRSKSQADRVETLDSRGNEHVK